MKMTKLILVALFIVGCDGYGVEDLADLAGTAWCDPTTPSGTCSPVPNCPAIWSSSSCRDGSGQDVLDAVGVPIARCLTTPDGLRPPPGQMAFGVDCIARGNLGGLSHCLPECPAGSAW